MTFCFYCFQSWVPTAWIGWIAGVRGEGYSSWALKQDRQYGWLKLVSRENRHYSNTSRHKISVGILELLKEKGSKSQLWSTSTSTYGIACVVLFPHLRYFFTHLTINEGLDTGCWHSNNRTSFVTLVVVSERKSILFSLWSRNYFYRKTCSVTSNKNSLG